MRAWDRGSSPRAPGIRDELEADGIPVDMNGDGSQAVGSLSLGCVVRSPGFALGSPLPAAALARGVPLIDELELGWRLDNRPVVGVTGTNGKSTVCELVRAVLAAAGHRPAVAGNTMFGPPYSGPGARRSRRGGGGGLDLPA